MNERDKFYLNIVNSLIKDKNASILICGGGQLDKEIFQKLMFPNVTISNLDKRMSQNEYSPYSWKYENAESLSFDDKSFDFVIIHAAIHHASSPHKVLTEMYRVASKGVLAFESRDSLTIRLMEKFHLVQTYKHSAVYYSGCQFGGVNNTDIPNFIYRWTEREIEKTINSYAPYYKHKFTYRYSTAFPSTPELENHGKTKYILLNLAKPFFYLFTRLFPRQQNQFAFFIEKLDMGTSLFPWLIYDDKEKKRRFNQKWGDSKYK